MLKQGHECGGDDTSLGRHSPIGKHSTKMGENRALWWVKLKKSA